MTVNRLPYTDPLRAGRHPFQTYLLALCVVSGAPMAAGQVTANSLEEQLPEPLVIAWGVMLVFGAVVALFGSYARVSYATALTLERVGLWSTGRWCGDRVRRHHHVLWQLGWVRRSVHHLRFRCGLHS